MALNGSGYSVVVVALVLVQSGCGGADKPVPVHGIVTLDGKPVPAATVSFVPDGESGHPATGLSAGLGAFELTTFAKGDGALPGGYRVVVTKLASRLPDGPRWTEYWDDQHERKKKPVQYYGMLRSSANKPSRSLLPTLYGEVTKTPLKCRVPIVGQVILELRSTTRQEKR